MPTRDKWKILERMRAMIDGIVGEWSKEAQAHIKMMEEMIFDDEAFSRMLKEWEYKLLPQCPGQMWVGLRQSEVTMSL